MGKRKKVKSTVIECPFIEEKIKGNEVKKNNYPLAENDRLTYIYLLSDEGKISEVINVSYELYIRNKWITIVRYDSEHGYLHRHMRISLSDPNTIVSRMGVIKKGKPRDWLTWAIKNVNNVFYEHKIGFCRRSKINLLDI